MAICRHETCLGCVLLFLHNLRGKTYGGTIGKEAYRDVETPTQVLLVGEGAAAAATAVGAGGKIRVSLK
jgi:hypothetical protein